MNISATEKQYQNSVIQEPSEESRFLSPREWIHLDLGRVDYKKAWDLQHQLVGARRKGNLQTEALVFLEHPPVFTLGRRGGLEDQKACTSLLESRGIPVIHVERGGDITYHGPGQLVVYPIVDLRALGLRVVAFVEALEEVMIRTLTEWNIKASRNPLNRGVWVDGSKIGSIGIAVRRSVSFHGLALNVNTELEPFSWVNPCGLEGVRITSMKEIMGKKIPMEDVHGAMAAHIREIFGVQLKQKTLADISALLHSQVSVPDRKAI